MIHNHQNLKEYSYLSTNKTHCLQDIYSLLTKSICRGDEKLALYAATQIPYPRLLKKRLLIFICEYMPNIHALISLFKIKPTTESYRLEEWVIKLCRSIKTRIVSNALRVVSSEEREPDESITLNDIQWLYNDYEYKSFLSSTDDFQDVEEEDVNDINEDEQLLINIIDDEGDEPTNDEPVFDDNIEPTNNEPTVDESLSVRFVPVITIEEEKCLIKNAFIVYQLLCRDGVTKTVKPLLKLLADHIPSVFSKKYINYIYITIGKRYLDMILILLSLSSLKFATSIDHLFASDEKQLLTASMYSTIPEYIQLPNYAFDLTSRMPINTSYKYFFDNLVMNPTSTPMKTDKFGIQKFISISEPIESSIQEYVKIKDVPNIYIARISKYFALYSTHSDASKRKYKYIIYLTPFHLRQTMKSCILADYIKSRLSLKYVNRRIIKHTGQYYIIQDNIFNVEPSALRKNMLGQTTFLHNIESFYPYNIERYLDNTELIQNILKFIIYLRMIGCNEIKPNMMIIHNNNIYSFYDCVRLAFTKTVFHSSTTKRIDIIFKRVISQYWSLITSTIKQYYKIISTDKVIGINARIMMLQSLTEMLDKSNWVFCDESQQ